MEWGTRGEETTCERKEPFWVLDFLCTGTGLHYYYTRVRHSVRQS